MSLDRTDSDGNNSGTAGLTRGESPQAPVSRDSDKYSDTARNRPQSTVSSNREEPQGTSMPIPPGASASASASPPDSALASLFAQESNRQHNTVSSDHESANDQKQANNTGGFTQAARQKRSKKHPLLGQRQAFTGPAETYDYTEMFEEDKPYTEMGPSARVWKVYNQEIIRIDSDRIEDWRDGLDSLLVFAALFSAVITTFVVQTSTNLQPDWGEVTANLLVELILVQRAGFNGTSVNSIPPSQLTPFSTFTPRPLDVAINALWFFSLALSLSTALAAIMCKQWIHQYTIMPSTDSLKERVQVHHFRFMGLEKWHVAGIIGLLPTFVHLSLGVFFVGLIIFLHDLSLIIGIIVDLVVVLTIGSYTVVNFLPIWLIDCPYKTPLTSYAFHAARALYHIIGKSFHTETSLFAVEKSAISQEPHIVCDILSWLMSSSSNNSVQSIAMDALSNLPPCQISIFKKELPSDLKLEETLHHHALQSTTVSESSYGRAIRALVRVINLDSDLKPYQKLFPLPDPLKSFVLKPLDSDLFEAIGDRLFAEVWLGPCVIQKALKDSDGFKCEPLLWCFYFDYLESTKDSYFLHKYSSELGIDIFWKMAQSVFSAISIDGLKRASSYDPRKLRWSQFMLDPPTNPNKYQKFGFKEMTSPYTIWEFFSTYPAPFLVQHILPVFKKRYDGLTLSPLPLVEDLDPDFLHLLHYITVNPVAWRKHPDVASAAISNLVQLVSAKEGEDQRKATEILLIIWTRILLSPDFSDHHLMCNWSTTMRDLLDKSINTLHGFDKDSTELIAKVVIRGIAAAGRIPNFSKRRALDWLWDEPKPSSMAEELAWNCFSIMSKKMDSALTEHPQWIPPLWKTLTEQKVLSLSVESMKRETRKWLYEVQQNYLAGLAPLQKNSSGGEEVFREKAIAYISGKETEPLTSLLRSTFFRGSDDPRWNLQESMRSLEWLAQLKTSENADANRIPKEKWLPCLKQVENELKREREEVPFSWEKKPFERNLKILRDLREYITGDTTLPPSQKITDSQFSRSSRSQGLKTKRSTWRVLPFRFRLRRSKREPGDEEMGIAMQSMSTQREVDARSSETGQSGTDASRDNGSDAEGGNETTSADRREVGQAGSSRAEDSGRGQTEGQSETGEVVGAERSQTPDKQGDHLSGAPAGGGTADGGNEDAGEAEGDIDKSVDSWLMDNQSRAEGDRTEGKRENTETGAVAEDRTSKTEGYEDDGAKDETRRESRSEPTSSAGESGVDEGGNQGTDTEQHVARRTGGLDEGGNLDTGGSAGSGALQEEVSGDDGAQTAATGMLSTTSSHDEDPKVDNNNDNQTSNVQSQTDSGRTEREGGSLHTRDSPEDGSKDDATHAGSRVEMAGGTDIIGDSGPEAGGRVNEVVSGTDNDIEDSEQEESGPNT